MVREALYRCTLCSRFAMSTCVLMSGAPRGQGCAEVTLGKFITSALQSWSAPTAYVSARSPFANHVPAFDVETIMDKTRVVHIVFLKRVSEEVHIIPHCSQTL